jgi:hypothetical protein
MRADFAPVTAGNQNTIELHNLVEFIQNKIKYTSL